MRLRSISRMQITFLLSLLVTGSDGFMFYRPCNCNNRCQDYNPCPPAPVCPQPAPCPAPFSFNAYPTSPNFFNSYAQPNLPARPTMPSLPPTTRTQRDTHHNRIPSGLLAIPRARLPSTSPLPTISQPDDYGYTANKIYRPVPEVNVPASTTAYEKPDEIIELENTNTDFFPRMEKVTVEPYSPPVSEYTPTYNEDHSTEVADIDYKNVRGGTTPMPFLPPEPTNETPDVGPTPSGYDSVAEPAPSFSGAGSYNSNNAVVPEYPDINTTPGPYSSTADYGSTPRPDVYGSGGATGPPADAAYSDTVYPIPPPSRRNAHFEGEQDQSAEVDERGGHHQMMRQLKIRRASTPPPSMIPRTSSTCNSEKLGDAMIGVIGSDVSISKRRVAKATAEAFTFDVFCAKGEFSYSIHARKYCEVTRGDKLFVCTPLTTDHTDCPHTSVISISHHLIYRSLTWPNSAHYSMLTVLVGSPIAMLRSALLLTVLLQCTSGYLLFVKRSQPVYSFELPSDDIVERLVAEKMKRSVSHHITNAIGD
ncbi:grl-2, partial [Pristionchus pacificus]